MTTPYRAAIIGTGRIASSLESDPLRPHPCTHAGWYAQNPRTTLVAGADTNAERLSDFGELWKLPKSALYSDYRCMFDECQPDIVSICAYASQRLEMCLEAIRRGAKALWIEKALGCSLSDALAIDEAVRANKLSAVVDHPRRLARDYRAIKRLIDDNAFGALQSVACYMTRQLIHTGTHAYDVLRYWCGEALSVQATLEEGWPDNEALEDQGGRSTIQMSSGTTAFISASRKKYYIFQFDLLFENARIQIGNDIRKVFLPGASVNYSGFKELFERPDFPLSDAPQRGMLADLLHGIDTDEEPVSSVSNAVEALKIGLAHFESHRLGNVPVDPNQLDHDFTVESV